MQTRAQCSSERTQCQLRVSDQLQCFLKTAIQSTKCIRSAAGYAAVFLTNAGFLMAGGYISKCYLGKS